MEGNQYSSSHSDNQILEVDRINDEFSLWNEQWQSPSKLIVGCLFLESLCNDVGCVVNTTTNRLPTPCWRVKGRCCRAGGSALNNGNDASISGLLETEGPERIFGGNQPLLFFIVDVSDIDLEFISDSH